MICEREVEEMNTVSGTYVPIDCDLHDYLEIAAIKNHPIRVSCEDGLRWVITVRDLVTKADKSEWLIGVEIGTSAVREIRLDKICDITSIPANSDFSFIRFK